jgi:ComF family protein
MVLNPARQYPGLFASSPLRQWAIELADLVFPPTCVHCGRVDVPWCAVCSAELDELPLDIHLADLAHFTAVAATGIHAGILQSAVQAFKYYQAPALALPLGRRLSACLAAQNWTFDMLIPVPLHPKRLAERGYNQSQKLCEVVAQMTEIPCIPDALLRHRDTPHQVGLDRQQRLENVADAFSADSGQVANKTLLIIDDVRTTGATLSACAAAALAAGARSITALTVGIARA